MRRFVLIGRTAIASGAFRLDDLPGSSGRLDALIRCLRPAFLTSHGLRRDVETYLVLRGGEDGPRTLRVRGDRVKFLRPDERSLALLVQKTLAAAPSNLGSSFLELRPGLELRCGDLAELSPELGAAHRFCLEEGARDLRQHLPPRDDGWFFIGDHLGFDTETSTQLRSLDCQPVSVGPRSLHAEDVITLVQSELDRTFATGTSANQDLGP